MQRLKERFGDEDPELLEADPAPLRGLDKAEDNWLEVEENKVNEEDKTLDQVPKFMEEEYLKPGTIAADAVLTTLYDGEQPKVFARD